MKRIHVTYFVYAERSNLLLNLCDDLWMLNCTSETHLSTIIIIENYFDQTERKREKAAQE